MNSCLRAFGILIFIVLQLYARPVPVVHVAELANMAELIVVGQITVTREMPDTTLDLGTEKVASRARVAQLRVQHVLKGTLDASELTVRFVLPYEFVGYPTPPVGVSRIFFLNGDGQIYRFTSAYRPSVAGNTYGGAEDGTLLDKLVRYVRATIESPDAGLSEKREAIYALEDIPGSTSTQALRFGSTLSETTLQLGAVAALLMRNDIAALQAAADVLLRPADGSPSEMRQNLLAGVSEGVRDPLAIPVLDTLLRAGDDSVRSAAASAMWHTNSPNAIGPLTRALDDASARVRYYAVTGLADITGQPEWRPTPSDFRDREAGYLTYWKKWVTAR